MNLLSLTKKTIKNHSLSDWLIDFPWLTGYLGDVHSAIWFIAENPSLSAVEKVASRYSEKSKNLQWDYGADERKLFHDAITEAGLKTGDPALNEGWKCYITNVIKEPEIVGDRNQKNLQCHKDQAEIWRHVLQEQINYGKPEVLVAVGVNACTILKSMESHGLQIPVIDKILHYSYIMKRPCKGRGPRHPERIREFKESVVAIAEKYSKYHK